MIHGYTVWAAVLLAMLLLAGASGCAPYRVEASPPEIRTGFVTDMAAFDAFIAIRPTAQTFRRVYPDVLLVMPGDISTREYRTDNSRYFAQVDAAGRIVGGRFQ